MNIFVRVLMIIFLLFLVGCGTSNEPHSHDKSITGDWSDEDNPIVTIEMETGGEVVIELYPEVAPNTVANFIALVESGFYDGLIFHRVIPGFMIQGGDPEGTGMGGSGYSIEGEFSSNGFENELVHERGVISMARSQHPDSAGSQFFIMVDQADHLDGDYAGFGQVISGMDIVDQIVAVETGAQDRPIEEQRMSRVVVDVKGLDYSDPVKIEN
ncbi:peptidylprolyl isomerase [Alkalihalobacillus sp. APA_J-10(15)]|nr:peptidylprolyl isomerase [Halalkalibacter sp. APA_J-10(15)]MCK0470222.1 peptidylprolyl isomerase [Halalkalibacter sp. APA_J-10(15)]